MDAEEESAQPAYQLRRATLEDLPELKKLWQSQNWPVSELEPNFTEFQLAFGPDSQLAAAVGLHIQNLHGHVHSETFARPELAVEIRPLLWARVLNLAKNHGLQRLWTLPHASFYREQGMVDVDETTRVKLPEGFGNPMADWVTLTLKDEHSASSLAEKEFEVFAMSQRAASEDAIKKAQAFRILAYGLFVLVLLALGALGFVASRLSKRKGERRR